MQPPLARPDPGGAPGAGPVDRAAHMRGGLSTVADLVAHARGRGAELRILVVGEGGTAAVVEDPDPGGSPPQGPSLLLVGPTDPSVREDAEVLFLGHAPGGDRAVAYGAVSGVPPRRLGARTLGLRDVGAFLPPRDTELLATAAALVAWHSSHRFCPACGSPTYAARGGWVRLCRSEGREHYPRVDPAMIVLVHDGADRCVLGRKPDWPTGRYSCLAGFVEPGESVEAAVVREVAEECGLAVSGLRYHASQPWPFPASLMLAFTACADAGAPLQPDTDELEDVRWFTREEVAGGVVLPPPASIAHMLITAWRDGILEGTGRR